MHKQPQWQRLRERCTAAACKTSPFRAGTQPAPPVSQGVITNIALSPLPHLNCHMAAASRCQLRVVVLRERRACQRQCGADATRQGGSTAGRVTRAG